MEQAHRGERARGEIVEVDFEQLERHGEDVEDVLLQLHDPGVVGCRSGLEAVNPGYQVGYFDWGRY